MRGSVTRRGDGVWRLRWDGPFDPETGKRRQQSKTVRGTKRQAEQVLNRLVGDPDHPEPDRHTVRELVAMWLDLTEAELSPKTIEDRRRTWRLHVEKPLGNYQLHQIRAHHLDTLYAELRKQDKVETAIKVHALLRGAFGQAVKWEWLASNPAQRATPPRQRKTTVKIPDLDAVASALAQANAKWGHVGFDVLVRLGALTGMRRGELCALRWRDIDFDAATIHVHRSVTVIKGQVVDKTTKTANERHVALGPAAVAMLRTHRTATAARLLELGVGLSAATFVFPADLAGAKATHPSVVTHRWIDACRDVGVSGIRLHDLRHHSASQLIAAGTDLRTVMQRHGWTSLATAQRYIHAIDARDREAAEALERVLEGQRFA